MNLFQIYLLLVTCFCFSLTGLINAFFWTITSRVDRIKSMVEFSNGEFFSEKAIAKVVRTMEEKEVNNFLWEPLKDPFHDLWLMSLRSQSCSCLEMLRNWKFYGLLLGSFWRTTDPGSLLHKYDERMRLASFWVYTFFLPYPPKRCEFQSHLVLPQVQLNCRPPY